MTCSDIGLMGLGLPSETAQRVGWSCGTVASAGSVHGTATATPLVSVVTGSAGGVKLPACDIGTMAVIRNATSGNVTIYSNSSTETFYIAATNTPANGQSTGSIIAQYYTALMFKNSATTWICLEIVGT